MSGMRRGRWTYHPNLQLWASDGPYRCGGRRDLPVFSSAWQLDGDSGWWLRRRTGAAKMLSWCGYCYLPPYSWWMLYRVPPREWLLTAPTYWSVSGRQAGHGICTHRHLLTDAMAAVERLYQAKILKSLADLGGL